MKRLGFIDKSMHTRKLKQAYPHTQPHVKHTHTRVTHTYTHVHTMTGMDEDDEDYDEEMPEDDEDEDHVSVLSVCLVCPHV